MKTVKLRSMGGTGKAAAAAVSQAERDRADIKQIHQHLTTALKWADSKGYTTIAADLRRCRSFCRALQRS